jgi:hypothetical protein
MSYLVNPFRFVTGGGPTYDPDAQDYFDRVATAGCVIADDAKTVVNNFVLALKAGDNYWSIIDHLNIFGACGSLVGAAVPLKGSVNAQFFNIVAGDYNRKTGIKGNASNKYINTGRLITQQAQNDAHYACHLTEAPTGNTSYFGAGGTTGGAVSYSGGGTSQHSVRLHYGNTAAIGPTGNFTGSFIISRATTPAYVVRANSTNYSGSSGTVTQNPRQIFCLARGNSTSNDTTPTAYTNARILVFCCGVNCHTGVYTREGLDTLLTDFKNAMAALA